MPDASEVRVAGRWGWAAAIALGLLAAGGCAPKVSRPPGYYGATEPLATVVERINANNAALPTLFARIDYLDAYIHNPKTNKTTFVNAEGEVFFHKPREMWLRGRKSLTSVFEIGSTEDRYWLTVFVDQDTMWWGYHRNAGKKCAQELPIRPEAISEVLGIGDIRGDLTAAPFPTMRFNNDLDVYMITWTAKLPDRWYVEKEIWYDRSTLRPRKVLLYDREGRVALRADLTGHRQVRLENVPEARWPWIATSYDLFFPDTKSRMMLRLGEVSLTSKTGQPKAGMIRFPEDPGLPEERVIQIDRDCGK